MQGGLVFSEAGYVWMRVYAQTYASSPELFEGYTGGELHEDASDAEAAEAYKEYARCSMLRTQPHAWRLVGGLLPGSPGLR